jgi:hypothetical protein
MLVKAQENEFIWHSRLSGRLRLCYFAADYCFSGDIHGKLRGRIDIVRME